MYLKHRIDKLFDKYRADKINVILEGEENILLNLNYS
jgi:hypothetical protein